MKKIIVVALACLLTIPLSAQSRSERIPFVDIAQAEAELKVIEQQITTYSSEVEQIKVENESYRKTLSENAASYTSTVSLYEQARNQKFALEESLELAVDREMRARLIAAIAKVNEAIASGGLSMSASVRATRDLQEKIRSTQQRLDTATTIVSRKKDRKAYLELAIAKTQEQIDLFTKQMTEFDSLFSSPEAQRLRIQTNR